MIEEKKKINLSFRVTQGRQEELKIVSARRRQSIQEMLEAGLELLLSEPRAEPRAPVNRDKNAKWHEMLDEVLSDPSERVGIEKNLQWAVESMRSRKQNPAGRAAARRVAGK